MDQDGFKYLRLAEDERWWTRQRPRLPLDINPRRRGHDCLMPKGEKGKTMGCLGQERTGGGGGSFATTCTGTRIELNSNRSTRGRSKRHVRIPCRKSWETLWHHALSTGISTEVSQMLSVAPSRLDLPQLLSMEKLLSACVFV